MACLFLRRLQERRASLNKQTTSRSVKSEPLRRAMFRDTWSKSRLSAAVFLGPSVVQWTSRFVGSPTHLLHFTLQNQTFCPPTSSGCYRTVALADHGCRVSCTGLYADVGFTPDNLLNPVIQPNVVSLMKNVDIIAAVGEHVP